MIVGTQVSNPYEVLGVAYKASAEDLRKAYLDACRANHPDKGGSPEKMEAIHAAWSWLEHDRPGVEKRLRFFGKWPAKFCTRCNGTGKASSVVHLNTRITCARCGGKGV